MAQNTNVKFVISAMVKDKEAIVRRIEQKLQDALADLYCERAIEDWEVELQTETTGDKTHG